MAVLNRRRFALSEAHQENMLFLYHAMRWTQREIAQIFGVSPSTVCKVVNKHRCAGYYVYMPWGPTSVPQYLELDQVGRA